MAAFPVPALVRRHLSAGGLAGALASAAGWVTGRVLLSLPAVPGLAGAAGVSYGLAAVAHGLAHRIPELPAGLLVAGVFLLLLDRQIP